MNSPAVTAEAISLSSSVSISLLHRACAHCTRDLDAHGKMPDLVVYLPQKNWLVLLEAAGSHGPVDTTRQHELKTLFSSFPAGIVLVSCFPSRVEMRKHLHTIAWETEVWCADAPTHLIHFNGERFLGPYDKA